MKCLLFLLLTGSLGLFGGPAQTSAQTSAQAPASAPTPDRQQLRVWQGRYPHHDVRGPRGRVQKISFFKLPALRKPLAEMLGEDFLDGVEQGNYLEEPIELFGDYLLVRLYPNLRRIEDEHRLIIVVPLEGTALHAVYYQEVTGADGQRDIQTDWRHSFGTSLDDLPESLKTRLATIMGLP
ncbi:hypothetical protein [Chloracidobacterium aggregatum]|jgi:hypothetical protein|uniref:DUF302 domain-containing protein n=1 Tax=Chloracidobacterium sp. N TaxID=2821540 RepID=A0ABX8B044_9BACT|nr:hypothetical protein [Chloracidobacterium aggregatum]QUV85372.1 hypothetical protein J8C03_03585 [Chloracidobacterium sp. 2]QUV88227.1 hypothetical protein J8C07_02550 [Chloracidobacterium sp. S]QUV91148.1 hypothetical protein J8C04_01710 [Chloracidobacterium sp. A]QUV94332.1 hypothetical protein J8C05_02475 [Chloracidobacterium sp. N]QUV97533.1 hypothetical protein J8C00_03550 [Chloracidobacterium sp. E]